MADGGAHPVEHLHCRHSRHSAASCGNLRMCGQEGNRSDTWEEISQGECSPSAHRERRPPGPARSPTCTAGVRRSSPAADSRHASGGPATPAPRVGDARGRASGEARPVLGATVVIFEGASTTPTEQPSATTSASDAESRGRHSCRSSTVRCPGSCKSIAEAEAPAFEAASCEINASRQRARSRRNSCALRLDGRPRQRRLWRRDALPGACTWEISAEPMNGIGSPFGPLHPGRDREPSGRYPGGSYRGGNQRRHCRVDRGGIYLHPVRSKRLRLDSTIEDVPQFAQGSGRPTECRSHRASGLGLDRNAGACPAMLCAPLSVAEGVLQLLLRHR